MVARMPNQRISGWMGRLFVVLSLVASYGAHADVLETVAPATLKWCAFAYNVSYDKLCVYDSDLDAAQATANTFYYSCSYRFTLLNCDGNGQCNIVHCWNGKSDTMAVLFSGTCPTPTVYPTIPYSFYPWNKMCARRVPDITTLTIALWGGSETEPSKDSEIKTLPIIATVINQNTGQPPTTPVNVHISVKVDPTSGGHDHGDNTRPRGGIATVGTCTSDGTCWSNPTVNGAVVFNFNAPEVSGTHTISATCDGCSNTATKTVDVKVDALNPIPALPFYALVEANGDVIGAKTGWHTDNHNLTPAAAAVLAKIAVNYRFNPKFYLRDPVTNTILLPPVLHLNDASLPWGGVYDICARPDACAETGIVVWKKPHAEHRRGTVIDVRANGADGAIPMRNKAKFEDYLVKLGLPHLHENQGTSNEHFHIRLMGKKE